MRLSTRNQLKGTIVEVRLDGGNQIVTASITKDVGLAEGQPATVPVKSTEVTIGVD